MTNNTDKPNYQVFRNSLPFRFAVVMTVFAGAVGLAMGQGLSPALYTALVFSAVWVAINIVLNTVVYLKRGGEIDREQGRNWFTE